MIFVVVYEEAGNGWSAYLPDLPGCIAAGETREGTESLIRDAITFHIEGLRESNETIPEPGTWTELVEISS